MKEPAMLIRNGVGKQPSVRRQAVDKGAKDAEEEEKGKAYRRECVRVGANKGDKAHRVPAVRRQTFEEVLWPLKFSSFKASRSQMGS